MPSSSLARMMARHRTRVKETRVEGDKVKSIVLDAPTLPRATPGQYLMVWLPGHEEIPISVSLHSSATVRITVAAVGPTSSALHRVKPGDLVILRGPYGRGFSMRGRAPLLIGGGYGVAPLVYAAHVFSESGVTPTIVVGGRSHTHIYHLDELRALGVLHIYTEDGTLGRRGLVTDALQELDLSRFDSILACGPEKMLKRIEELMSEVDSPSSLNVEFSLERIIKCGVGVCGSCSIGSMLVCRDGPVFTLQQLRGTEFGAWRRDPSGGVERIDN